MWTPGGRRTDATKDVCETCGLEVEAQQASIECDICEKREHVECVRQPDRIESSLYAALIASPSMALLYSCTTCRCKGSIVKQLYKLQSELAVAHEQRLASTSAMDEACDLIAVLKADKEHLQPEVDGLREWSFNSETPRVHRAGGITTRAEERNLAEVDVLESSVERSTSHSVLRTVKSENLPDATSSDDEGATEVGTSSFKQPKGFKELRFRVDKFSGDIKEIDFDVWLDDFLEATNDCGWSNADRAKWFSWFLSGPAKSTWQKTLKSTHKESWEEIVSVYRGQYGVHMDPRTAYQRCNELQYEQFKSVQA